MSVAFYHIAHLVGLILLFIGFGGMAGGYSKAAMKYHGIGLVILLVAGFGLIAKLHLSYTMPFIIAKLVIFVVLGGLPVLLKRGKLSGGATMWIAVVLGGCAAYLGYLKALPF
jgi:hypothetical protein